MDIRIWHTDMSGHQNFSPNGIYTLTDAVRYISNMNEIFGNPPFQLKINNQIVMERKDSNQDLIIYK